MNHMMRMATPGLLIQSQCLDTVMVNSVSPVDTVQQQSVGVLDFDHIAQLADVRIDYPGIEGFGKPPREVIRDV